MDRVTSNEQMDFMSLDKSELGHTSPISFETHKSNNTYFQLVPSQCNSNSDSHTANSICHTNYNTLF